MKKVLLILFGLVLFVSAHSQTVTSSVWFAPPSEDVGLDVRIESFAIPSSSGDHSFNISGWDKTPVAAKIVLVGSDGGADPDLIMGIGFTDGTTDVSRGFYAEDNVGTTNTHRYSRSGRIFERMTVASGDVETSIYYAVFSQWNTGGIELTFTGSPINTESILITFFAGENVSAEVVEAAPGDHVESLSFTSKLIFSAYNWEWENSAWQEANWSHGVCTNGTNGLEQNTIAYSWPNNEGNSWMDQVFFADSISGRVIYGSLLDQSAISNIDATGFNLSDTEADPRYIAMLCLDFDEDVDSDNVTMPTTSADISITTPGFTPQAVGIVAARNTALNTADNTTQYTNVTIGEYDGTNEYSVAVSGEDNVGTTNFSSHTGTNIIEMEDPDANDDGRFSFDTFTANGFDLTNETPADAAWYYIWWAVEQ